MSARFPITVDGRKLVVECSLKVTPLEKARPCGVNNCAAFATCTYSIDAIGAVTENDQPIKCDDKLSDAIEQRVENLQRSLGTKCEKCFEDTHALIFL